MCAKNLQLGLHQLNNGSVCTYVIGIQSFFKNNYEGKYVTHYISLLNMKYTFSDNFGK